MKKQLINFKLLYFFTFIVLAVSSFSVLEVYAAITLPSFKEEEIELYDGEKKTVHIYQGSSYTKYNFEVDDEGIIEYDYWSSSLDITGLKEGKTNIRLYDSYNRECDVLKVIVKKTTASFEENEIQVDAAQFSNKPEVKFSITGNDKIIGLRSLDPTIAKAEYSFISLGIIRIKGCSKGTTKIQLYNKNTEEVFSELTVNVIKTIKSISLNDDSKSEIYVGQTVQRFIKQDLSSISDVPIWSSSNVSVAIVSENGIVTGVGKGNAEITVAVGKATASYSVSVKNIGIQKKTFKIQRYGKQTIEYEGVSGGVSWKISNKKIATIKKKGNKCIVTGKKTGKTKLTATYKGKKQVITIKVIKPQYDLVVFAVSPDSKTKYSDVVSVYFENKSTRPIIIHKDARITSNKKLLSGKASMAKDYKIKPGKRVNLSFKSDQILKINDETAFTMYFTFEKKTMKITYRGVNSLTGIVEYTP